MYINIFIVSAFVVGSAFCEADDAAALPIARVISECIKSNSSFPCFSEKAAIFMEKTMDESIPILEGMSLQRNGEKINYRQARNLKGFDRFENTLLNFFHTHVISLDLGQTARGFRDGGFDMMGGGGGGKMKKGMMQEKGYMQYAFMVLLGIFGLTGPIIMKVIAVMAAKALLAAKAALIIVGSVALKKLFEKEKHKPSVKVHTIEEHPHPHPHHEEEYDRMGYYGGYYHSPYSAYDGYYNTPTTVVETSKINISK